ncbi:RGS-domain-containing protein [Sporormia fimetaria CBS 119925]|uniref:RGS-domain-containing protein n=1 Tax=Sporormia fimetaria CBS 119925 TaxID=1340428 RepID=A0A6A6UWE3_9PLEO|nr:RGS-domain-containing protein [Sporormia fimetaria CBS 119925]
MPDTSLARPPAANDSVSGPKQAPLSGPALSSTATATSTSDSTAFTTAPDLQSSRPQDSPVESSARPQQQQQSRFQQPSIIKADATKQPSKRRSTLTSRFPLLSRKASRESPPSIPSSSVSSSFTSSTSSSIAHRQPSDSAARILSSPATSEPRASTSSTRGRNPTSAVDSDYNRQHSRDPSSAASSRSAAPDSRPDSASIKSATAPSSSNTTPDLTPAEPRPQSKMHQTSSRLLRMTDDERPFTRDFKDLFSTLMVSLPLTPHRVRFRMIDFTFTSDEAITNLGSLKFSQSNRMPDPKDSSRVVTTTTTTTFSMAKEMARSVCQKFLEAKFIESVENKLDFTNKSSVWQLTPKGIHILERFCLRNGIQSPHVKAVIDSNRNPRQLVILERNTETDQLHHDEQTVQIIFRRFVGQNVNEVSSSDSDSIHEFSKCDVGVRMIKHRPTSSRPYDHVFTGKATVDWLMDCCTMVDRRESLELGDLFLQLNLIAHVDSRNAKNGFIPSKQVQYYVTPHGEKVAGWVASEEPPMPAEQAASRIRDGATRDSNSNRTLVIIRNPSWRLLYREFLKETMCEENLSFYLEAQQFNRQYKEAMAGSGESKIDTIRETLAAAYGLYNAFLAPGSPNELNIDHALRTQLATRMTRAVGDDTAMEKSLEEVAQLFDKAQNSIFKLMSSDSVPKFIKHPKYGPQLRGVDAAAGNANFQPTSGASRS